MRIFPPEAEQAAFNHERLRAWRAAGLLAPDAAGAAEALAGEPPAHAAWPLRLLLFGFAALVLGALSVLALKDLDGPGGCAATAWFLAAGAIAGAEGLIRRLKVRRFGAEEALVAGAVVLFAFGAERFVSGPGGLLRHFSLTAFSAAAVLGSAAAYLRYGYRLASLGTVGAVGALAGSLEYGERPTRLLLAALFAGLLAAVSRWPGLPRRERERLEIVRFLLALLIPLCLNLRLDRLAWSRPGPPATDAFGLATLAAIFAVPLVWLAWGVRDRSRTMLWAGGLGLLIAQCSVKPYLGLTRNSWDPAVLGVELMLAALVLKRWLDAGPGGRRAGFSSEALGETGPGPAVALLAAAASAAPSSPPPSPDRPRGGGGSFGGGGASGGY